MTTPVIATNVVRVYSGKPGCMCGCLGKYWSAAKHAEAVGLNRGYALSAEDISDKQVTRIVNTINSNLDKVTNVSEDWVEVTIGNRIYVAYTKVW